MVFVYLHLVADPLQIHAIFCIRCHPKHSFLFNVFQFVMPFNRLAWTFLSLITWTSVLFIENETAKNHSFATLHNYIRYRYYIIGNCPKFLTVKHEIFAGIKFHGSALRQYSAGWIFPHSTIGQYSTKWTLQISAEYKYPLSKVGHGK
jgi:hypothetical protein